MIYLARQPAGRPVPADRIAEALRAPANYLSKTLRLLAREGLLESTRGPGGGFRLAVPAEEITIERLSRIFDDPRPNRACLLGGRLCDERNPCGAHARWEALRRRTSEALRSTTVSDLLSEGGSQWGDDTRLIPQGG